MAVLQDGPPKTTSTDRRESLMRSSSEIPSAGTILVVDARKEDRQLIAALLTADGFSVLTVDTGHAALSAVMAGPPDLVVLEALLPGLDGLELCKRLKADPATHLIPIIILTALQTREDKIAGLCAGADDYFSKPANPQQLRARIRSLVRLKRLTEDLASTEAVMLNLAATIEERDPHIQEHCQRVAAYAIALGVRLDLSDADLVALHRAAFLHDIGMVTVPDAVLLKPGPLTEEELAMVRVHPVTGDHLCGETRALAAVRPIVRSHHERYDGSGYPDGLRGDAIPLTAQILGIADAYDAMTTPHPHHQARSSAEALRELRGDVERGWRREDLVDAFIALAETHRLAHLANVFVEQPYQASLRHVL